MEVATKLTCEKFIEVLASSEPAPGGGGAAALAGAIGVALGNMVGSLTLGKQKYADVEPDILELKIRSDKLQARLLKLVKRDGEVFHPLSKAYSLPNDTEKEKARKSGVMEACLRRCSEVPLEIMDACAEAIELHEEFALKGTVIAISDVGCGVILCKAAMQAASLNVFVNTRLMEDASLAKLIEGKAYDLLGHYLTKADSIFETVSGRLIKQRAF